MDVTQLILFLVTIIVLTRFAAVLSRRLGIPAVTLQLLTGALLGPSLFNLLGTPIVLGTWGSTSPTPLHGVLKVLGEVGLIQLMFFAGLRTDWRELGKDFKPILSLGVLVFGFAAVSVALVSRWFVDRSAEAMALGAIMGASSFGISAYNFTEMKCSRSNVENTIPGVGALAGLFSILVMVASLTTNYGMAFGGFKAAVAVSWFLGKLVMFFAISYFLMSRYLNRIARTGFEKRPRQTLIGYLLLVAALYAWGAMHFGSFAAVVVSSLGGGLLGIYNVEIREKITKGFGSVLASIPVGLFFVTLGMEVNFRQMKGQGIFFMVVLIVVVVAKLAGSWISTRRVPGSPEEQVLVAIGNLPQGEMGTLIAAYSFSRGLLTPSSFNIAITAVLLLTMLAPVLMKMTCYAPFPLNGRGSGKGRFQPSMEKR